MQFFKLVDVSDREVILNLELIAAITPLYSGFAEGASIQLTQGVSLSNRETAFINVSGETAQALMLKIGAAI